MLDRLLSRGRGVEVKEEVVDRVWEKPEHSYAKHLPKEASLMVVHPRKGGGPFWLKVERREERGSVVYFVGKKPGILNSETISIAGNTEVYLVK